VAEAVRIAEKYDLPRDVFLALVQRESNFNPTATSNRGAIGLTQLMPDTARELGVDPRDPAANLDAGARYLRQQITRFGSLPLALAAYNAGPRRVTDAGNQVPRIEETVKFVDNILRNAGMEGYLHPQHDPEKGYAEGGLASLDQKYADGGTVRRPAAAPVPRPSDEDYLSILADRAVGAGEPVAELRSAEGRGFAPMPRSFGEAGQRMSAVIRGNVEPTPEEERQISHVRGFTESPASIRAYHGSPYRFDRFDISKIGTGEGSQAFGHGLYFAEAEPVAFSYLGNPEARYARFSGHMTPREEFAFDMATKPNARDWDVIEALVRKYGDTISFDEANELAKRAMENRGHMYEVRLNVKPEELINWDASLNAQAPIIREFADKRSNQFFGRSANPELEGQDIWRMASPQNHLDGRNWLEIGPAADAARRLREAGIHGIKYFDEASRAAGRGTHNYVMFGDDLIDLVRRYEEGGEVRVPASEYDADEVDRIVKEFAQGGEVEAPAETTIGGQEHKLAYITNREAALLKARGGSGRMTRYGIRAYDDANGNGPGGNDSDSSNSNSEAGAQDAAGGNAGQGAGPTGAGAGATGEAGPGPTDSETGVSGSEDTAPDTETATTAPTTAPTATTGPFGQAPNTTGLGAFGTAVGLATGVPGLGTIGSVVGSMMDAANLNAQLGMMGLTESVNPTTAAVNAATMGMVGQSAVSQFGQALGFDALAEAPMSAFSTPNTDPAPPSDMGGGEYLSYGQTQYGAPNLGNIATAASTASSAPTAWDWNEIQRQASLLGMSVDEYMASRWKNLPLGMPMKKGGLADLHAKYSGGGSVSAYDPRAVDQLAQQIEAEYV
jgi:hypothetical protein